MSLETWKALYYPVPADQIAAKQAGKHCLHKWIGLRPAVLKQHGLEKYGKAIKKKTPPVSPFLIIDSTSCAYCQHYLQGRSCEKCPLNVVRGGVLCDDRMATEIESPYKAWTFGDNPSPMIAWLKKAIEWERKRVSRPRRIRHAKR